MKALYPNLGIDGLLNISAERRFSREVPCAHSAPRTNRALSANRIAARMRLSQRTSQPEEKTMRS